MDMDMAGTQQARLDRLRRAFPEVDDENLIETLDACSGDVKAASQVLQDVLDDEASDGWQQLLTALVGGVTRLALLPPSLQPTEERNRLLHACASLETHGIRLKAAARRLLAGDRDEASLTDGLDVADAVVVRQMVHDLLRSEAQLEPPAQSERPAEASRVAARCAEEPGASTQALGGEEVLRLVGEFEEVLQLIVQLEAAPEARRAAAVGALLQPLADEAAPALLTLATRLWGGARDPDSLVEGCSPGGQAFARALAERLCALANGGGGAGGVGAGAGSARDAGGAGALLRLLQPSAEAMSLVEEAALKSAQEVASKKALATLKQAVAKQRIFSERRTEERERWRQERASSFEALMASLDERPASAEPSRERDTEPS